MSALRVAALSCLAPWLWPSGARAETVELEVAGFRAAIAVAPVASGEKRPLLVALHGNYDRPEWQCEVWSRVVGRGAFVLCPRGVPRTDAPRGADRWTWDGLARTSAEVNAAVESLVARFAGRVDAQGAVLAGFSLGATMAARIGTEHPERFPRLVLVEGGEAVWTSSVARRFAKAGGVAVLAACGQSACLTRFRSLRWAFDSAKVGFRVVGTAKAGHTYDGDVAVAVAGSWPWLVEGDPRLSSPR